MKIEFLIEKHNFKNGDDVAIFERYNPALAHSGTIYKIVSMPLNNRINKYENIYIDHFYVTFEKNLYSAFLKRGSQIIYNHVLAIVGNIILDKNGCIEKIYKQDAFNTSECEIDFNKINAILIWSDAYEIKAV